MKFSRKVLLIVGCMSVLFIYKTIEHYSYSYSVRQKLSGTTVSKSSAIGILPGDDTAQHEPIKKQTNEAYIKNFFADRDAVAKCSQTVLQNLSLEYLRLVPVQPNIHHETIISDYKWHEMMQLPKIAFDSNFVNPCFFVKTRPDYFAHAQEKLHHNMSEAAQEDEGASGTPTDSTQLNTPTRHTVYDSDHVLCPELRCLPAFFFAGWPKAGSTDFFYTMKEHQTIVPTRFKEINFWDNRKLKRRMTLDWYTWRKFGQCTVELLSNAIESLKKDQRSGQLSMRLTGDFTPAIDFGGHWEWDPWNSRDGATVDEDLAYVTPKYLIPDRIKHVLPNSKIIFMLRNPIDRVYSFYNAWRQRASTQHVLTDLHTTVTEGVLFWRRCTQEFGLSETRCAFGTFFPEGLSRPKPPRHYVYAGLYEVYLREYFRVFSKQNVLILKFEDYREDPLAYVERFVLPFLGLPPYTDEAKLAYERKRRELSSKPANARKYVTEFKNETRAVLDEFYSPYNKRLVDLLGEKFQY